MKHTFKIYVRAPNDTEGETMFKEAPGATREEAKRILRGWMDRHDCKWPGSYSEILDEEVTE